MLEVKILKKKDGTFQGRDGSQVKYYWYKALRSDTQVTINFGSRNGDYEEGDVLDILLEKYEKPNGEFAYKEVI